MKKRATGQYQKQITVTVNGEKKQKCFYGKTIAEVNQKLLNYKGEVEAGKTFEAVAEEWWEEHQKTLSSNSLKNYKPAYERAKAEFSDSRLKEIAARHIKLFITQFAKQGHAQKTVSTQLQIVRQILAYAIFIEEIEYNPATTISVPKNLAKTKRETPTAEEIAKIKNSIEQPFSLFALFALYTGCRRGELLALQYKDIDFVTKEISITKSVYHVSDKPFIKCPKTAAGNRRVVLLSQLEALIPKQSPDDFIFNFDGEILHNKRFSTLWKNYCKALSVQVTPHQLRHAYATRLYELGIDEKSAQDLLGHSDLSTTHNIYVHITEKKRKITASQLQDF